jgi:VIT1/CCC1 family predicted Fe2+/Mn2+ transporter
MARDALAAHARDELGITSLQCARPVQAALASAAAFAFGAFLPLFSAVLTPAPLLAVAVPTTSLTALALLGGLAAWTGGASAAVGARRVVMWGAFAMAATHVAGRLVGTTL